MLFLEHEVCIPFAVLVALHHLHVKMICVLLEMRMIADCMSFSMVCNCVFLCSTGHLVS